MSTFDKPRIMVVDDTPLNLLVLMNVLKEDYDVTIVESALLALPLLAEEAFDLILLDIMMPEMDGFTAFGKIREIPGHERTPIIFVTASTDRTSERYGLQLGAVDFIFKPIRADLVLLRIRNILHTRHVERELQASEKRLQYVMAATGEGVWDWKITDNTVEHNVSWCRILGLPDDCLVHPLEFFADLIHQEDFASVQEALYECLYGSGNYQSEHRLRHADGHYIWVSDRGQLVQRDAEGQPARMVGSMVNIDRRKQNEAEIHRLAFYDALTGLPNRRLFLDRLQQALHKTQRAGQCGALMFIDLDRFKELNDTHGHAQGDALLIQVGVRLQEAVRRQDSVARLGGDEFVVLLENLDEKSDQALIKAQGVGDKILNVLNQPYLLGSLEYSNTPSIGLVVFSQDCNTLDEVLAQADRAMYAAKKAGRNALMSEVLRALAT